MEGQYVAYTFYRVDPAWRRLMPPDVRQAQKEEFAEVVDSFAERYEHLRAYTTAGVRAVPLAEKEGAVGGAQRAHAKAVEHVRVGMAPVAPGQETCEIGFEIASGEARPLEGRIAREQHAAVPDSRLLALLLGKVR